MGVLVDWRWRRRHTACPHALIDPERCTTFGQVGLIITVAALVACAVRIRVMRLASVRRVGDAAASAAALLFARASPVKFRQHFDCCPTKSRCCVHEVQLTCVSDDNTRSRSVPRQTHQGDKNFARLNGE